MLSPNNADKFLLMTKAFHTFVDYRIYFFTCFIDCIGILQKIFSHSRDTAGIDHCFCEGSVFCIHRYYFFRERKHDNAFFIKGSELEIKKIYLLTCLKNRGRTLSSSGFV